MWFCYSTFAEFYDQAGMGGHLPICIVEIFSINVSQMKRTRHSRDILAYSLMGKLCLGGPAIVPKLGSTYLRVTRPHVRYSTITTDSFFLSYTILSSQSHFFKSPKSIPAHKSSSFRLAQSIPP